MIVSDSTTLIILSDLKRLDLLSNLFKEVIIPQSVYDEITVKQPLVSAPFIHIRKVDESELLTTLLSLLDRGESEAIALAVEMEMPLIIDEKKGRKIARNLHVDIIGLLGILYLNIQKGFLTQTEAQTFLKDAVSHGYRISQKLIDEMFSAL